MLRPKLAEVKLECTLRSMSTDLGQVLAESGLKPQCCAVLVPKLLLTNLESIPAEFLHRRRTSTPWSLSQEDPGAPKVERFGESWSLDPGVLPRERVDEPGV